MEQWSLIMLPRLQSSIVFYSQLLRQADVCARMPDLESILSNTALTATQAATLIELFSLNKLRTILFSMKVDIAPGPDGFIPLLFRTNWDLFKDDLLSFLNAFHSGTADLERINKAYLALLPKKATSLLAIDCRPISLRDCITQDLHQSHPSFFFEEISHDSEMAAFCASVGTL